MSAGFQNKRIDSTILCTRSELITLLILLRTIWTLVWTMCCHECTLLQKVSEAAR